MKSFKSSGSLENHYFKTTPPSPLLLKFELLISKKVEIILVLYIVYEWNFSSRREKQVHNTCVM